MSQCEVATVSSGDESKQESHELVLENGCFPKIDKLHRHSGPIGEHRLMYCSQVRSIKSIPYLLLEVCITVHEIADLKCYLCHASLSHPLSLQLTLNHNSILLQKLTELTGLTFGSSLAAGVDMTRSALGKGGNGYVYECLISGEKLASKQVCYSCVTSMLI